jgi:type IV pilus assembly protein PilB
MTRELGTILLDAQRITATQLSAALRQQTGTDKKLGETLVELGFVTHEDIARALATQMHVPFVELGEAYTLRPEEVRLLPEAVVRRYCMFATCQGDQKRTTLIMRDPLDLHAVDTARTLTHLEVHKAISTEARIRDVIERHYGTSANIQRSLQSIADIETSSVSAARDTTVDTDQMASQANEAPVVRFVSLLLLQAVECRASDIHIEPGERDVHVRMRVDGVLQEHTPPPRSLHSAIITRIKILACMDIAERRLPLDGRFQFKAQERLIDVRVSSLPEIYGEKIVMRLLDRSALVVDMTAIGFEEQRREQFQRILQRPNGIILLTGPTGSGKTTTLYSAIAYLRNPQRNIQTVEDPVEYQLAGINQMQVKAGIGLGFAEALRAILRQDPDIIMIGEIRDRDTAEIAMRAALTGHLVLSTLHTNDAPSAVTRLRDIGMESYLIAATIRLIIAQRLARRICNACRTPYQLLPEERRLLLVLCAEAADWSYQQGTGCSKCAHAGFHGRVASLECMEITDILRETIATGGAEASLRRQAIEQGMQTLLRNGLEKARLGMTTVAEVLECCTSD